MRNRLCSSTEPTGSLSKLQTSNQIPNSPDEFDNLEQQVCLFGPERYEPRYDYPLIVWLHSCHSCELELENVMPELSLQNYVSCAPRGTVPTNEDRSFFRWGQTSALTAIAEEIVFESIALSEKSFSIDPKRVFLAGFGSGGTTAWRIALRYPDRFAGAISICGGFPKSDKPLLNLQPARGLKTLWMYGEEDQECGVQQVCKTLPVMHAAGLDVDIRQYPCGKELLANMLTDMNAWVMGQITPQSVENDVIVEATFSRN